MGKLKFPKENEKTASRIDEAKKLLSKSYGDAQILLQVYNEISACAEAGSPRASFFKACMLLADEAETGDNEKEILSALSVAERGKYPLAAGLKADYLFMLDDVDRLYEHILKAKYESPQALYAEGGIYAGYSDMPKGARVNRAKACICFERSARLYLEYAEAAGEGVANFTDITTCFGNLYYFSEQAGYAFQMLMSVYSDVDDKANKQKYIAAYEDAQKYGDAVVKYKTTAMRARDCMHDVMGMHSLKTVNAVLNTAKSAYAELSEGRRDSLKDNYDGLWDTYDKFYEYETERLKAIGNTEIYTSADYGRQDSLLSDLVGAVRNWSASRTETGEKEYTVTADNETYNLNEHGEMVDKYGRCNGLRVDKTSKKVYNEKNDLIGFFDSFGEFHKY